jgi:hypothetical protein
MIYRKISVYHIFIAMKPNTRECFVGVVYANWCPHCKTLVGEDDASYIKSDWHRIKTILENAANKGIKYLVDKTESENDKEKFDELKTEHNIVADGFPTIYKYYINNPGEKSTGLEYFNNGPRNIQSILTWARSGFKFSGGGKSKRIRIRRRRRRRTTRRGSNL